MSAFRELNVLISDDERTWREAALAEPWVVAGSEGDEPAIEVFRT